MLEVLGFALLLQWSSTCSFPYLHFCLKLELLSLLFPFELLYLLCSKLVDITSWKSVLADSP